MAVVVDDSPSLARIPLALALYKFCFSEIFVVIDIPHGGCNYGPVRLKGGPRTFAAFMRSSARPELLADAQGVLDRAAQMHARRCPRPLRTRAQFVDYEAPETFQLWRSGFFLEQERPSVEAQRRWPWAFMWKNSMAYMIGVVNASGEFVLHVDDDFGMTSANNTGIERFMRTAIQEFDRAEDLVFAQLFACRRDVKLHRYKSVNGTHLLQSLAAPRDKRFALGSYVSAQVFLTSRSRWPKMYPLPYWRHLIESSFQVGLSYRHLRSVFFQVPGLCKTGFGEGARDTPLEDSERKEAQIAVRRYSSNATHERFDLAAPHGGCKLR